ncbi:sugar phosphate isomerase/epimerase [Oscillospiraceae bacterium OttesenSCG-928-F05]|nr:sugar phosphate isomerase/epimerase [Oscillospiraceae bacterium OttesenSCG-928-F05]
MKVGLQLFSIRDSLKKDPYGTLRTVRDLGYRYIEFANHSALDDPGMGFGLPVKEMKKVLDDLDIKIAGGHIMPLDPERLDEIIAYHSELGTPRMGYSNGPLDSYENLVRFCGTINKVGKIFKENGIRLYFHTHYREFLEFNGKLGLQILLDETDPSLVDFELDTFWAYRAGVDPIKAMDMLGPRMLLMHQKDLGKNTKYVNLFKASPDPFHATQAQMMEYIDDSDFVEIGTGTLPIQAYIDRARSLGVEYIILEQDQTQLAELESIKLSMEGFKKFSGVEWD